MAHNNNNSRDRDHSNMGGGGPRPPTIPSPYDPSQHFQRASYSPRDPRDWRLPPPGLSSLAMEPAFGNRFRSDNNAWRPLAAVPLTHPINLHAMPPNVDYLHHWNRPPFLRPDVPERSEEPETRQGEDPGRPHRMFGTVEGMRNCEQAVHQHFEESFRIAQQKGVWRAPIKDEADKPPRLSMLGSARQPIPSSPQLKTYETHPPKPRLDQHSPRIATGRAPPLPIMTPPRMTLPFSHPSDNNFMYHNDRAREMISPPVVNDRAHFSSSNHAAKSSPVQPYVTGPVHRIKVSSPAPPQIYGKPGIHTYGPPSSRSYETLTEPAPLSLISKVSTRPSDAPPLMSGYKGNQNPGLKTVAHYMFNQSAVPGRSFSVTPTPPSQNSSTITPPNEYQTQPLDLGGKRKSNSEPLCLNFKKVRNEFHPEPEVNKPYFAPTTSIELASLSDHTRFSGKPTSGTLNLSKERDNSRAPVLGLVKEGKPFIPMYLEQPSATIQRIPRPLSVQPQGSFLVKNETNDNLSNVSPKPKSTEPDVKPEVMKLENESRSSPIENKSSVPLVETSRNSSSSSYPVHKLKKAWLERLTGEDAKLSSDTSRTTVSPTSPKTNSPAKKDVEYPSNAAQAMEITTKKAVSPALVESKNPQVPGVIRDGGRSPVEMNRIPHMRKKAAIRARSMAGLTNGHDSRAREHSSSDSDPPAKRPRPKGRRRPLKDRKEKACTNASFPQSDQGSSAPACVCGCGKRHEHKNYNCDGRAAEESESTKDSDDSGDPDDKTRPFKTYSGQDSPSPLPSSEHSSPCKTKGRKSAGQSPVRPSERKKADPLKRLHTNLLKKTGQSFLQDGSCNEVAPKLGKCRECRWSPSNRSRKQSNIFCRFYAFRKLRYTKNGVIAIAGFSDPLNDPSEGDTSIWLPSDVKLSLELDLAKFLITQVGDQFCEIFQQEKEALQLNAFQSEKPTAWKRVVQGVREMCDVCDTTLFNYHWACGKCGFVVCILCYKSRKQGTLKVSEEPGKDRDNFQWLLCSNRQGHEDDKLMLVQAIAGDALTQMTIQLHRIRAKSKIPQECHCEYAKKYSRVRLNDVAKSDLNGLKPKEQVSSDAVELDNTNVENVLASMSPAPDNNNDKKIICKESKISKPSELEEDGDEGHSTLRELLIRPSPKKSPDSPTCKQNGSSEIQKESDSEGAIKSSVELNSGNSPSSIANDLCDNDLSHFVRHHTNTNIQRKRSVFTMSLSESSKLYSTVPHSWLCDGRVLHLHEPQNEGNYKIFREVWRHGQPTVISKVTNNLDPSLWTTESFTKDFDSVKTDLTDFMTGKLITDQPAKKFWDGFGNVSMRLKDENGEAMLLKFGDFTYEEDFSESHPSRFHDFLTGLPLSEYTQRTGRLNLVARLPENFVKPDLGPKMYLAYGSGLNMNKGTTNLHLDISDVVNVLVHVGIPKDSDNTDRNEDILKAINESDCDELTIKRVTCDGERPGALWHIYNARDADKIRDLLNKVSSEQGKPRESHHDPLKDDNWYLNATLRKRLVEEYNVIGYPVLQFLGDAIFIPAGAPNQVRTLQSCVNVAVDFISPESVSHCFQLTQEFRGLSTEQAICEDKVQIKSIIYHAVKDALSVLTCSLADEIVKSETKSEESCTNASDITNTN